MGELEIRRIMAVPLNPETTSRSWKIIIKFTISRNGLLLNIELLSSEERRLY